MSAKEETRTAFGGCDRCFALENQDYEQLTLRGRVKLLLTLAGCLQLLPARLVHLVIKTGGLTHV